MSWMTTDLYLPPRPEWDAEWAVAVADPFIARKTDRARRMREHQEYVSKWLLDAFHQSPGLVIDVGPGCGELLEMARAAGHDILGVDAPDGAGGMGDAYLRACRLMHERQRIPVVYERALDWLAEPEPLQEHGDQCVAVNFRGSIEQCMSEMMLGPPHDTTQDSRLMSWKETRETQIILECVLWSLAQLLRTDGRLVIHANGALNTPWYARAIDKAAEAAGLTLRLSDGDRMRVWIKG